MLLCECVNGDLIFCESKRKIRAGDEPVFCIAYDVLLF